MQFGNVIVRDRGFTPFLIRVRALLVVFAFALTSVVSLGVSQNLEAAGARQLIRDLGFQDLQMDAIDFTLQDLDGTSRSLSDYKGRWVWLVFWATWCSACSQEMPQLESLYVSSKDAGLVVLGVSIDDEGAEVVRRYAKKRDLTFPIVHDQNHKVSGLYQARSVPTVYLISPDQKAVGILRGSSIWENKDRLKTVNALLQFDKMSGDDVVAASQNIPEKLLPPKISVDIGESPIRVGQHRLTVVVGWHGNPGQYQIRVPTLELPDGVKVSGSISSRTSSDLGRAQLLYDFPLEFAEGGRYLVGPIELRYAARGSQGLQSTRLSALEVEVRDDGIRGIPSVAIALAVLVILGLSGGGLWYYRRCCDSGAAAEKSGDFRPPVDDVRTRYFELKKMRISGRYGEYGSALVALAQRISSDEDQELGRLLERLKYGGGKLSDTELRVYERQVEHFIEPDKDE